MDGWIKLHRSLLDSRVFANESLLKVWVWCLLKANHKGSWVSINTGKGEGEVEIKRGEFIFGRKSASKELRISESTVYRKIKKLQELKKICQKSNTHYTLVSICNYSAYQNDKIEGEQTTNRLRTDYEQTTNTNKNDKNKKNIILSSSVKEIIDFLNETANKNFKPTTKKTKDLIKARMNEGFTVLDFKRVISLKTTEWMQDPTYNQYLRPETLFSPKFEGYLNQSEVKLHESDKNSKNYVDIFKQMEEL